jgi:hypothetical protein
MICYPLGHISFIKPYLTSYYFLAIIARALARKLLDED